MHEKSNFQEKKQLWLKSFKKIAIRHTLWDFIVSLEAYSLVEFFPTKN